MSLWTLVFPEYSNFPGPFKADSGLARSPPIKKEPHGIAAGERFILVARLRPFLRARVHVDTLEGRMRVGPFRDPLRVVGIVGRHSQFGAVDHRGRKIIECLGGDDAALLVTLLRPRVRKENEGAGETLRRQLRR